MAIRGKIIAVCQMKSGTKQDGKTWQMQEYVLQTEGKYPKKVAFTVTGDKISSWNVQMGNTVEIEVDAESREYQGKWYTTLKAYRCNNLGTLPDYTVQNAYSQAQPQGYQPTATPGTLPPGWQNPPQGYNDVVF